MSKLKFLLLRNRYTVLLATLFLYLLALVSEGALTGRKIRVIDFENPFFDLNIRNFEEFRTNAEVKMARIFTTDKSAVL